LIFFAQHLFEPTLLPSPEELIVKFIEAGCPLVEPEYELASEGNIAEHWRRICEDRRKTLLYEEKSVQARSTLLRDLGKLLYDFHDHQEVRPSKSSMLAGANLTVFELIDQYDLASRNDLEDPATRQYVGLITLLVVLVLCGNVTLDRLPFENFWSRKGVTTFQDRVHFALTNYPALVAHGPFHLLATMISAHTDRTFSRGMIFDCFHAIYAVYADDFLTSDSHFTDMRSQLPTTTPVRLKIRHLDELEMRWVQTSQAPEAGGWLDL
jgi:hypothetical protein